MNFIGRLISVFRSQGASGVARSVVRRITKARAESYGLIHERVSGKRGLEVGGPSAIFAGGGMLPVYPVVASLDNCNYGSKTVWEGTIEEGITFQYASGHTPGRQFISEATDLDAIGSETYDFLLSSHTIEHTANPIKALREWVRVVKEGGILVLLVPHRDGTFDHRRPVTTLEHLIEDSERNTGEDDLTHLPEILALHDLSRDPGAGDGAAFEARSRKNLQNRCLHHHVFDTDLVVRLLDFAGLQMKAVEPFLPHHILAVAEKLPATVTTQNESFIGPQADYRSQSPFATDKLAA